MSCSHCGAESAEGNFCSHCGERLTPTACQACGQLPPPGSTYCTHCGELMEGSLPGGFAGLPDKRQKNLGLGSGRNRASGSYSFCCLANL
jgi:hypothetical protein